MSILEIKKYGNEVLRTPSKEIHKVSVKTRKIVDDLLETMYSANGVGLAAPQVGLNIRMFVIDVSTGNEPLNPMVFINPKIVKKEGGVLSYEGCLSFPDVYIHVRRYERIIVKAKDHKNRPFAMDVNEGTLLCRAIQHEFDHLDGVLYIDHSLNRFETNTSLQEKGLPFIQEEFLLEEPELDEIISSKQSQEMAQEIDTDMTESKTL